MKNRIIRVLDLIFPSYRENKRKKILVTQYDKQHYIPVIKCSICTGEKVAGFKEISTGKFHEIQLIENEKDLVEFTNKYQVEEITNEY